MVKECELTNLHEASKVRTTVHGSVACMVQAANEGK